MAHRNTETAFIFVVQNTLAAQAGAAILASKLIAVADVVSAFTAFDSTVDQLKHSRLALFPSGLE
jgi:hypothetical protein